MEHLLYAFISLRTQHIFGKQFIEQFKLVSGFQVLQKTYGDQCPVKAAHFLFDIWFLLKNGILNLVAFVMAQAMLLDFVTIKQAECFNGALEFAIY